MNFFIYSRKSVYTGKGESIENQIEMCKQYIHQKYLYETNLHITVYEDEGFSAKNTHRPHFLQMLKDIKTKKPNYIVCYRLDRISRNVSDFSALIEELNQRGISFICIKEEFDTSKPMGKAMMYIASVFAQLERETIAERVRDNMLMLARTGRWLGGTTPTGYTSEKIQEIIIDGKIRTSCKLKEIPEELKTVSLIFHKYFEMESISGVSKYLINQNIKSRNGKFFSLPGIKQILQNPVYCIGDREAYLYFKHADADICFEEQDCSGILGLLTYNKRDYKKKHAPRQSIDKWIVAIGKHKGLICGKDWVSIQEIIKNNIPTGKKPSKIHNCYSLLSGIIYCKKCGSRMFAKPRKGIQTSISFDYICNNKLHGGINLCDCQNINGSQADQMICDCLKDYIEESPILCKLIEKLNINKIEITNPIDSIQEKIKKCNEEIENLVAALSENTLNHTFIQHINNRIKKLDDDILYFTQKQNNMLQNSNYNTNNTTIANLIVLSNLKETMDTLTIYEKRKFVKHIVKKIIWDGENLDVFI